MLQPVVRRTWAPVGQTPIHATWDRRDRISVIGALTVSPRTRKLGVYFTYQYENIKTESVVLFVQHLHRQLHRRLILVWDRWSVHRAAARRLLDQHDWLSQVEFLPSYSPELNPVEAMWSYTKHADLANFIPDNVHHLEEEMLDSLARQSHDRRLKRSFFKTARLDL